MRYYKFIATLAIVTVFLALQGCKKEKAENKNTYQVSFSRYVLDYVKLTLGKYLIYKDSATSVTDSVVVTGSILENIHYPATNGNWVNTPEYYGERFTLTLTKIATTGSSSLWFSGTAIAGKFPVYSSDTSEVSLFGGEGNIIGQVFFQTNSQRSNEMVTIEGKIYNNIVITIHDSGLDINNPNYRKTIYYWARGVGIIKRTIITTSGTAKTFTLLRNN